MTIESRRLHLGPGGPKSDPAAAREADTDRRAWQPRQYCWAVKIGGQVIGEVELVHDSPSTALLRRLRIDPAWQRTAALSRLIDCAGQFCTEHGRLRLRLEPGCAPRWVLAALRRRGIPPVQRLPVDGRAPEFPPTTFAARLAAAYLPG